jgi:hypothetical protein
VRLEVQAAVVMVQGAALQELLGLSIQAVEVVALVLMHLAMLVTQAALASSS